MAEHLEDRRHGLNTIDRRNIVAEFLTQPVMATSTFPSISLRRCFERSMALGRLDDVALFYWMAAAAFPLMFHRGLPRKKLALFALIGRGTLSVSRVRRDIQPIRIACGGNGKPAKTLIREMNFAAR
jgi:hypothetical protein